MTPEDLLQRVLGFTISGRWLHSKGKPSRVASAEEQAMWACLYYQAEISQRVTVAVTNPYVPTTQEGRSGE